MKRMTWVPFVAGALLLMVAIPTLGASVLGFGSASALEDSSFSDLVRETEARYAVDSTTVQTDSGAYGADEYGYGGSCEATSTMPPY